MTRNVITFDSSIKLKIIDLFDKCVDDEGYLVEKENPNQRVLSPQGEEITLDEFGGIIDGCFVKNDVVSLMNTLKNE